MLHMSEKTNNYKHMKTRVTGLGGIFLKPKTQKLQKHGMQNILDCPLMTMGAPFGGPIKTVRTLLHSGLLLRKIPRILNQVNNPL